MQVRRRQLASSSRSCTRPGRLSRSPIQGDQSDRAASRGSLTCAGRRVGTVSAAVLFSPPILLYDTLVEVRESAHKQGCTTDDIRHAITNALAAYDDLDDPYVLYLGPDIAGSLLEVLTAVDEQGEEIAFHAMPMRRKYRRLLP